MQGVLLLLQEAAHEAGGGGGGPFSINPGLIIWTLVVFGILMALLWRLAWPAILKSVEERERRIQKQLEDAEKANTLAQQLLEEHKKTIAGARSEAQEMIAKGKAVAQKERELLLAKAREEYEALLARARKDIEAEKEKALVALRREAVELSIAAAAKVIDANLDTEANRRLVTDYLATLDKEQKH
ncbi:MAG TPA: F0F1 ATP synthase subunit B [Gemmatimonadales bacterium]|nr:F0F1 ATP synthase subunit B [Gemmatimonadales bacterium]